MEFFSHKTNIDFMSQRKWAFAFSLTLLVFSIASLFINGLNLGMEFTGGTQIQVKYQESHDSNIMRQELEAAGFHDAMVSAYGSSKDFMVKLKTHKELDQKQLTEKVMNALVGATFQQIDVTGPQVGKDLAQKGVLAIIIALIGTMLYIAFRFEYKFALSAAISLIHDPVLILGIFSFFHIEFDLIALAAMLTVIGYSLNDTIVVYDRVRENFRKVRKADTAEILNLSINQTLSRTIMISSLTFSVILALYIFGGQMLHGFSLAMMIGIVIGTYSSIYIAGALAILFGLERHHLVVPEKKVIDNMP